MTDIRQPVRVLHLDDDPIDAELVTLSLEMAKENFSASVTYVQTEEQFREALEQGSFDIILSDYRMPRFSGDEALKIAQEKCPDIPFIMVTGELGEERAIETLHRGATDYVLKDRMFRLIPAIERALAEAENQQKRREAEAQLHAAHRHTSDLLETIQDAFLAIDKDFRYTYVNRHAEVMLGRRREEMLGRTILEVFPGSEETVSYREWQRALREHVPVHYEAISHITDLWIEVHAYPTNEGGLAISFRDISERKQTEENLRFSEQKFAAAFHNTVAGMSLSRLDDGFMIDVNQRWLELFGYRREEVIGRRIVAQAWKDPEERSQMTADLIQHGFFHDREVQFLRADGTEWTAIASGQVTIINGEKVLVGSVFDITARKRTEEKVRALSEELEERVKMRTTALEAANKELESFSYTVSHDLKAPLRVISGYAEMLSQQNQENFTEQQQQALTVIQQSARRMDQLIKSLLEFSRYARQALKISVVDTRHLIEEVVEEQRRLLENGAGSRVNVQLGELPPVKADSLLLRQVFVNLLSNAFKFTRTVAEPRIQVTSSQKNGQIMFIVTDNGVGFPREQAGKLFEVFQRLHMKTEFEGTGVGLANVRKIVERHGGVVCADGEVGKGAAFYFTLPHSA